MDRLRRPIFAYAKFNAKCNQTFAKAAGEPLDRFRYERDTFKPEPLVMVPGPRRKTRRSRNQAPEITGPKPGQGTQARPHSCTGGQSRGGGAPCSISRACIGLQRLICRFNTVSFCAGSSSSSRRSLAEDPSLAQTTEQ
jgi:hypothetical protein